MSVEPQALERSVLEAKARDELQAIATAIGARPGSRARKAEIVEAILAHAGLSGPDGAPEASPTSGQTGSAPGGQASVEPNGSAADTSTATSGESTTDRAPAEETDDGSGSPPDEGSDRATTGRSDDGPAEGAGVASPGGGDAGGRDDEQADAGRDDDHRQGRARGDRQDDDRAGRDGRNRARSHDGEARQGQGGEPDGEAQEAQEGLRDGADQAKQNDRQQGGGGQSQGKQSDRQQGGGGQSQGKQSDRQQGGGGQSQGKQSDRQQGGGGQSQGKQDDRQQGGGGQSQGKQDDRQQGGGGQSQGKQDDRQQGGGGQSQGKQDDRQQGGGGQARGDDDGEPGNRRRRRRGRNRDQRDEEEQTSAEPVPVDGVLDLRDEGYGFLRTNGYLPSRDDVYVSAKQVRQMVLRKGDLLAGTARPAGRSEKNPAMIRIDTVNGVDPEQARRRPRFEDLTPLFPDEKLRLERPGEPADMTSRIIDLISPIGKGQRGMIVSPPKAGKTMVMKTIAQSIEANDPAVELIVLLVDERPEEVTDMRRSVRGEVVASTFDRPSDEHTQVAELTIERAKRMVEEGKDVVIILDGITRLARAYNLAAPATGRIMSGGVDSGALYPPKRFFGAARNIEEGGSLTILATALVETGSRMDQVIFEEFKGTGNMELRLDRKLADKRIYPAIDVDESSTRHEELLFERRQLNMVWKLRRVLSGLNGDGEGRPGAGLELLIDRMRTFASNDEFLAEIAKAPTGS